LAAILVAGYSRLFPGDEKEDFAELRAFGARVIEPRARHSRQLLHDAQRRGEISPGADLNAAMELLIGSLFTRALAGDRSPHPWPERAVDTILTGLRPGQQPAP